MMLQFDVRMFLNVRADCNGSVVQLVIVVIVLINIFCGSQMVMFIVPFFVSS